MLPAPTALISESSSTVMLSVEQADVQAALHIVDSVVAKGTCYISRWFAVANPRN